MDPRVSFLRCENPLLVAEGSASHPLLGRGPARYACGVCDLCVARWSRDLRRRAMREYEGLPAGELAAMLTLTFSDAALELAWPDLGKAAWRAFCQALSRLVPDLKLLGLPELGSTRGRLHLHGIAFGVPAALLADRYVTRGGKLCHESEFAALVTQAWARGFVNCARVSSAGGIGYVLKYATKGRAGVARELALHRARARLARERGQAVPSFATAYWTSFPRGRAGGLGASFADAVVDAQSRVASVARASGDVLPLTRGGKGRLVLSRYETRRVRRGLGLDDEASKRVRALRNPEPVEVAARVLAAGGVRALRLQRGHVDDDQVELARQRLRSLRSLGRA